VVIPPAQAYGQNEVGDIPPGSILVFVITVDSMEPTPLS
jgi:FKBP-type peptidyl-prolyl cis-trans isomerase